MATDGLRFFIEHVKALKNQQKSVPGQDGFEDEYKKLKAATDKYKQSNAYARDSGAHPLNKKKNRYKDILPYDHSRVELPPLEGLEGSDYINANYLKGASGGIAYIAAQGPLPATVADFWRMLWCLRIQIVIMVCKEVEMGKRKCSRYWAEPGETLEFDGITVREARPSSHVVEDVVLRNMVAEVDNEQLFVQQFHYTEWPDHGVPDTVDPILDMIQMVRDAQPGDEPPIVVHCSAGCGRTGAVCVIDYVWSLIKQNAIPADFSLSNLVCEMRQQRVSIIQTKEQYVMVYKAVLRLVKDELGRRQAARGSVKLNTNPSSSIYENVEQLGKPTVLPRPSREKEKRKHSSYENTDLSGRPIVVQEPSQPNNDNASITESADVEEDLMTTDIDSYQFSTEDTMRDQNEDNELVSDEETPPPIPFRTPESNELLVSEVVTQPSYGNVASAQTNMKGSSSDSSANQKGPNMANYSVLGHTTAAESVEGYGTLSREKGAGESHEYSSFNSKSKSAITLPLDKNGYETINFPSQKQTAVRIDDYDRVGANLSSYHETGKQENKAEEGAYSVIEVRSKDSGSVVPASFIGRARSESPSRGSPAAVGTVSPNSLCSTLPRSSMPLPTAESGPPPSGGKLRKFFKNVSVWSKPSKQPKPLTKLDITGPSGKNLENNAHYCCGIHTINHVNTLLCS
jgi:protein tyrosine phosphatase